MIEFARNDYRRAFQQFTSEFLEEAYFLYLDTDIKICKQRIRKRITDPQTDDDYYVSDYIFEAYYNHDDGIYLAETMKEINGIDEERIKIVNNNGGINEIMQDITDFIQAIISKISPEDTRGIL